MFVVTSDGSELPRGELFWVLLFYLCCNTRMMGLKWPASWLSFSGQEGLLLLLPLREGISVGIRVGPHLA